MGKKRGGGVRIKQLGPKGGAAAGRNPMDMMPTMEDFAVKPEDQIRLPPTPDRNYRIVWPITETFTIQTDEPGSGFQIIYPSYLDAAKTVKQGRRVPLDMAVPKPTVSDISLALQALKIRHVLQPYKGYSRDPSTLWENPGRVVVDMASPRLDDTTLLMVEIDDDDDDDNENNNNNGNKDTSSKSGLMRVLCERIPNLPERQARLKAEAEQAAVEEAKQREREQQQQLEAATAASSSSKKKSAAANSSSAATNNAAASSSSTPTSSSKKKGKKGRKK